MTIVLNGTTGITNDGGYTGDGVVFADTTPANTLVTTTGGNVGIGTGSPGEKLDVIGVVKSTGFTCVGNYSANRANGTAYNVSGGVKFQVDGSTYAAIAQPSAQVLAFYTGNDTTERARIDSSGLFFINCTSAPTANATGQLNIIAGLGTDAVNIKHLQNGNNFMNLWQVGSDTCAMISFKKGDGETTVGSISSSTSGTAYNTSSDYRLKNSIAPITGALEKVAQLKPCTYKWNADNSDGEGFIAHELAEVVPQCVTGEKDAVNEDGSIKPQGIDTSFLVATLTAAIQEQQAIITALTARVAALEGTQP